MGLSITEEEASGHNGQSRQQSHLDILETNKIKYDNLITEMRSINKLFYFVLQNHDWIHLDLNEKLI